MLFTLLQIVRSTQSCTDQVMFTLSHCMMMQTSIEPYMFIFHIANASEFMSQIIVSGSQTSKMSHKSNLHEFCLTCTYFVSRLWRILDQTHSISACTHSDSQYKAALKCPALLRNHEALRLRYEGAGGGGNMRSGGPVSSIRTRKILRSLRWWEDGACKHAEGEDRGLQSPLTAINPRFEAGENTKGGKSFVF